MGVHSDKRLIRSAYGEGPLTFEELLTMVAKAEGILNSKPISPLINDPQGLDPLTPRHFIIGTPLVDLPTPSLLKYYESLIDRWKNNSVKVRFLPPLSLLLYLFIVFF